MDNQQQIDQFLRDPRVYGNKLYFIDTMKKMDPRFAALEPGKQEEIFSGMASQFAPKVEAPAAAPVAQPKPETGSWIGDTLAGVRGGVRSTADLVGNVAGLVGLTPVKEVAHNVGQTIISDADMAAARERSPWLFGAGYGAEQLGEAILGGGLVKQGGQVALKGIGKYLAKEGAEKAAEAGAKTLIGKGVKLATQTMPGQFGIYSAVKGDETGSPSLKAGLEGAVEGALFHKVSGFKNPLVAAGGGAAIGGGRAALDLSDAQGHLNAITEQQKPLTVGSPEWMQLEGQRKQAEAAVESARRNTLAGAIMGGGMTVAPRIIPSVTQYVDLKNPKATPAAEGNAAAQPLAEGTLGNEAGIGPVKKTAPMTERPPADSGPAAAASGGGPKPTAPTSPVAEAAAMTEDAAAQLLSAKIGKPLDVASARQVAEVYKLTGNLDLFGEAKGAAEFLAGGGQPAAAPAAAAPEAKAPLGEMKANREAAAAKKLKREDLDQNLLSVVEGKGNGAIADILLATDTIGKRKSGNTIATPGALANELVTKWGLDAQQGVERGSKGYNAARNAVAKKLAPVVQFIMEQNGMDVKAKPSRAAAAPATAAAPGAPAPEAAAAPAAEGAAPVSGETPAAATKPTLAEYEPGSASRILANNPDAPEAIKRLVAAGNVQNTNQLANKLLRELGIKAGKDNKAWEEMVAALDTHLQANQDLAPGIKLSSVAKKQAATAQSPTPPAEGAAPQQFASEDAFIAHMKANGATPDMEAKLREAYRAQMAGKATASSPAATTPGGSPGEPAPKAQPINGADLEVIGAMQTARTYFGANTMAELANAAAVNAGNPNIPAEVQKAIEVLNKSFSKQPLPTATEPAATNPEGVAPNPVNGPSTATISEAITKINELNAKRAKDPNLQQLNNGSVFTRQDVVSMYPNLEKYSDDMIDKLGVFARRPDGTFTLSEAVAQAIEPPDATRTAVLPEPTAPKKKRGGGRKGKGANAGQVEPETVTPPVENAPAAAPTPGSPDATGVPDTQRIVALPVSQETAAAIDAFGKGQGDPTLSGNGTPEYASWRDTNFKRNAQGLWESPDGKAYTDEALNMIYGLMGKPAAGAAPETGAPPDAKGVTPAMRKKLDAAIEDIREATGFNGPMEGLVAHAKGVMAEDAAMAARGEQGTLSPYVAKRVNAAIELLEQNGNGYSPAPTIRADGKKGKSVKKK